MKALIHIGVLWTCMGILMASEQLYKLDIYTRLYYSETQVVTAISKIACAIISSDMGGPFFSFKDGICKVRDPGKVAADGQAKLYRKFKAATDAAFSKPTLSSVPYGSFTAAGVVDGDDISQFHSKDINNPWWSVDLEDLYVIRAIEVLSNKDVADWFINIKIYVGTTQVTDGDFSSYTEVDDYPGPWDGIGRLVFTPTNGTSGRYVAIQGFSGWHFLVLSDVKVMV